MKPYYKFQVWKYPHVHIQSENEQGPVHIMRLANIHIKLTSTNLSSKWSHITCLITVIWKILINHITLSSYSINVIKVSLKSCSFNLRTKWVYFVCFYHYNSRLPGDKFVIPCLFTQYGKYLWIDAISHSAYDLMWYSTNPYLSVLREHRITNNVKGNESDVTNIEFWLHFHLRNGRNLLYPR